MMSVYDDMIEEYEKKKANLQHQIIELEFGHSSLGDYLAGTHTTCSIELARREIAAIDAALVSCREEIRRSR